MVDTAGARLAQSPPARRPRRGRGPRGPELVGRAAELALLADEYTQAAAGEFHCVLLAGEPGVGKTRLAAELLARHAGKATVLQARAHPMATTVAFGLWAEALDPHLQLLGDDEVADLCGGFTDDLAGLFHRVAAVRGPGTGGEAPRPRLLAGLTRMIDEATRRGPVVVLLDDIHWADASSWEVLRHLARRLDAAPLLVIATARPVELTEHEVAAQVLFELEQDGLLTRLEVAALDVAGLRALAEQLTCAPAPPALIEWLMQRSLGNALFAIGLLRALLEEGADLAAPALRRLPENLTERVAARIRRGDPEQTAVLELMAVAGGPVPLGDLVTLTGRPLDELGPLLTEIVAVRGLVETERGRALTYEFAHPLVRDVVYEHMGGARRRLLHRQIGRMLREAGRVAEAALHYARSAEPGDPEAVDVLVTALREAEAREAVAEALGLLDELVELLPAADRRWLDVLEAMNWQAEWLADHRAAGAQDTHAPVAVRALRAIEGHLDGATEPERLAVVAFRRAHFLAWGTGDLADAQTACEQARELFALGGEQHQVLRCEAELAWILGLRGDLPGMQATAEAVLARAEDSVHPLAVWSAVSAVGFSTSCRGEFGQFHALAGRVSEFTAVHASSFRHTAAAARISVALALEGHAERGRRLLDEATRTNPQYRDTVLLGATVATHLLGGDYPAALEAARESARSHPAGRLRRLPRMVFGALAAVEMAEPAEAAGFLQRAHRVLNGRNWQIYLPAARHAEGLLEWSRGEVPAAVATLRAAADGLLGMDALPWASLPLSDLAEAAAEVADPVAATLAAADLSAIATRLDRPLYDGLAAVAAAWSALRGGDVNEADAHAQRAVAVLTAVDCPPALARAQLVLGRAASGLDRARAVTALEEAARIHEHCGGAWRRARVLDALRREGGAGRRAMAAALGPGSLTRRERDVARLAAQGQSAREIAGALFVGERTVETHLGNVYAKLGVGSKLDLVRRAAELGLG